MTERLGRYRLIRELGAGAMATVWLAADESLGREVAVKILHPHYQKQADLVRRLTREGRAAAGLEHPNVLKVHDVGEGSVDGAPSYLVLELVRGTSLKEFLDANGPPLAEVVAAIGAVIARALAAAHAASVIHRDLKPANVLLAADGRLVLADFGMARVLEDDATLTATGALLGTPAFMSPEQALGQRADARSDLYALGATLYQLATGVLPVSGAAGAALAATIRGDIVPPLRRSPKIGRELARLIERLMAKDPAARPADAAAVAVELEALARPAFEGKLDDGLRAYFADPGAWNATALPRVLAHQLAQARASDGLRAAAYLDRILAFDPTHAEALALARARSAGEARRRVFAIAAGVAVVAAGGALAFTSWSSDVPAPTLAAVDTIDAAAAAPTPPADAARAVVTPTLPPPDARPLPPAPAPSRPIRAATPRPLPDAATTIVPAGLTPTPPPDAAPRLPEPGYLAVRLTPWCDVTVDGAAHGRSPLAIPLELSPGPHHVVCKNPAATFDRTITIVSRGTFTLAEPLIAKVKVTVAIDARIEGTPVRAGTVLELTPGNHRVEARGAVEYVPIPTRACTLQADLGCH